MYERIAATETTTKSQLGSVRWMITERTVFLAFTRSYFVSTRLPVTRVAVVRVSVAKPKSYRAAVLALEIDVVSSVFFAIFDSRAYTHC